MHGGQHAAGWQGARNGVEDQQGKVAEVTDIVAINGSGGGKDRAESISDGKKVHLTGSTTRLEKNWTSTVFAEPEPYQAKRKLLGGQGGGKEGLGFSGGNDKLYSKRDVDFAHSFKRSHSSFLLPMNQTPETKASEHQKRFKVEEMISPAADWSNPQHQPTRNRKNTELGVVVERRGR